MSLQVDGEMAEAVAEVLGRFAHQGVALEYKSPSDGLAAPDTASSSAPSGPVHIRAYLPHDDRTAETRRQIERVLWPLRMIARQAGLSIPTPTYTPLADSDWTALWRARYHPIRAGKRLIVIPAWEQPSLDPQDIPLIMEPGQAFGTGTHPTTQLCLAALEQQVRPGDRVLDLGCGSGILAIAALKLGASHADALDIAPEAVQAAQTNATANGVGDRLHAAHGSLAEARAGASYDLVVANILSKTLVTLLAEGLAQLLTSHGTLILSGILGEQVAEVLAALKRARLHQVEQAQLEDWVALIVSR